MKMSFNIHEASSTYQVTSDDLIPLAGFYGLNQLIPGRFSWLFVLNLMLLKKQSGIDPSSIIDEIRFLEGIGPSQQTKPESQLTGSCLKGLWHKHFLANNISVFAKNIANQLSGRKLENLVNQVFDPSKNAVETEEMIGELSHRIVVESLETRAIQGKLTGEWIIFAKEGGQNYYLCVTTHESGDENIANSIKAACLPQFPFLAAYVS